MGATRASYGLGHVPGRGRTPTKYNKMYDLTSEKVIKARSKSFEERIETDSKFKYKDTGDIGVK
jgi:hypothetical protein